MKAIIISIALFFTLGVVSEVVGRRDLVDKFSELAGVGVAFLSLAVIFKMIVKVFQII